MTMTQLHRMPVQVGHTVELTLISLYYPPIQSWFDKFDIVWLEAPLCRTVRVVLTEKEDPRFL